MLSQYALVTLQLGAPRSWAPGHPLLCRSSAIARYMPSIVRDKRGCRVPDFYKDNFGLTSPRQPAKATAMRAACCAATLLNYPYFLRHPLGTSLSGGKGTKAEMTH